MTVVVAVACPDAIVLASESRTTQRSGQHHRIASDTAQKIFSLWDTYAVATYGIAAIDRQTIKGLIAEFVAEHGDQAPSDTEVCAEALGAFFSARLQKNEPPRAEPGTVRGDLTKQLSAQQAPFTLGFLVAGHDPSGVGVLREVRVATDRIENVETGLRTDRYGITSRGQDGAVRRLIHGVDWTGLEAERDVELSASLKRTLKLLEYDLIHPVTLSDAADLAEFLVDLTVKTQRFTDGTYLRQRVVPGCGGPVQMLACTSTAIEWLIPPVSSAAATQARRSGNYDEVSER